LTKWTAAFGVYSVLNCRLIADWSVYITDNINPDMTPYRMLLDVSVSPKKNLLKDTTNI